MNFTPSDDIISLLEFIESKKKPVEEANINEIMRSYLISLKMALINTYTEQDDITLALSCSELIGNIFIIIYSYSLNIKLSLFICERAILLFNEYMNISNNYNSTPVHISDIKLFIISKSIGPIILKNTPSSITDMTDLFKTMGVFMNKIFVKCRDDSIDYVEAVLENILKTLPTYTIQLFQKDQLEYINDELYNTDLIESDDIISIIDELGLKLRIYLFIYNTDIKRNIDKVKKLTNITFKHTNISHILDDIKTHNHSNTIESIITNFH